MDPLTELRNKLASDIAAKPIQPPVLLQDQLPKKVETSPKRKYTRDPEKKQESSRKRIFDQMDQSFMINGGVDDNNQNVYFCPFCKRCLRRTCRSTHYTNSHVDRARSTFVCGVDEDAKEFVVSHFHEFPKVYLALAKEKLLENMKGKIGKVKVMKRADFNLEMAQMQFQYGMQLCFVSEKFYFTDNVDTSKLVISDEIKTNEKITQKIQRKIEKLKNPEKIQKNSAQSELIQKDRIDQQNLSEKENLKCKIGVQNPFDVVLQNEGKSHHEEENQDFEEQRHMEIEKQFQHQNFVEQKEMENCENEIVQKQFKKAEKIEKKEEKEDAKQIRPPKRIIEDTFQKQNNDFMATSLKENPLNLNQNDGITKEEESDDKEINKLINFEK
ncbi:hypothetical protein EIN_038810 [Entamoeba invadens IP1]|uniref:Uncharacterized protein n=1 Tax=Entamoeba invadens IP1 TaxID=370355 RepID=L7FNN5_ENTIV|nr:hypothetical protein EIN_038810 [Entamoeba invadens IP1]ELP94681.1 hypothetical protein EIN_038810 [Entamoeba invadens IP1]|eukprot:XP_004261452.1 hypothetical protein EIN_038810 [Entamoeba invadens IP1]